MKHIVSNADASSVAAFGREWARFDYNSGSRAELEQLFERYFGIFPWDQLPASPIGFDFGCGSGRWARLVAPRAGVLHCIDASPRALEVARHNLLGHPNCKFHLATAESIPIAESSADFGFSLGVLHHIPDPQNALNACVRKLKAGAPFLLYVYYNLENRPAWFRNVWRASIVSRLLISHFPHLLKIAVCDVIAALVYFPLARLAGVFDAGKSTGRSFPLSQYQTSTFYTMRTDALDRFGTPLERRFSRKEVERMMLVAGLTGVRFSESIPFWVAMGHRASITTEWPSSDVPENKSAHSLDHALRVDPNFRPPIGLWRWLYVLLAVIILTSLQCAGLKSLPYASCILEHLSTSYEPAPERSGFRLGSLFWDVPGYSREPRLEPFRNFYRVNCEGTTGISAAMCVSGVFARKFPFGADLNDFCDRNYDPADALRFNLDGNPGHCMQRSGLLAAVLLSSGIPARVVQILGERHGHTLIEVWAAERGWILFDPSTGYIFGTKQNAFSSLAMLRSSGFIQAYPIGLDSFRPPSLVHFYKSFGSAMKVHVLYPEPWLYLRTGRRLSFWPFRGRYVSWGNLSWRYGLGQRVLFVGIFISFLAAPFCAVMCARTIWLILKRTRNQRRSESPCAV